MHRPTGRGVSVVTAALVAIVVGGCEGVEGERSPGRAATETAAPAPEVDPATASGAEQDYPPWLQIDGELVREHLAYLEGREPPAGLTGAPGWDMERPLLRRRWTMQPPAVQNRTTHRGCRSVASSFTSTWPTWTAVSHQLG